MGEFESSTIDFLEKAFQKHILPAQQRATTLNTTTTNIPLPHVKLSPYAEQLLQKKHNRKNLTQRQSNITTAAKPKPKQKPKPRNTLPPPDPQHESLILALVKNHPAPELHVSRIAEELSISQKQTKAAINSLLNKNAPVSFHNQFLAFNS